MLYGVTALGEVLVRVLRFLLVVSKAPLVVTILLFLSEAIIKLFVTIALILSQFGGPRNEIVDAIFSNFFTWLFYSYERLQFIEGFEGRFFAKYAVKIVDIFAFSLLCLGISLYFNGFSMCTALHANCTPIYMNILLVIILLLLALVYCLSPGDDSLRYILHGQHQAAVAQVPTRNNVANALVDPENERSGDRTTQLVSTMHQVSVIVYDSDESDESSGVEKSTPRTYTSTSYQIYQ